METERFGVDDWLKSIGGVLFFVAGLLPWWEESLQDGLAVRFNAFDYRLTGLVPYVVFVAIALLTIIIRTGSLQLPNLLINPLLTLIAAFGATVLVGIRFFYNGYSGDLDDAGMSVTRGVGLYLAAASALIVLAGSIIAYRARHDADVDEDHEELADEVEIMERYAAQRDRAARRQPQHPPLP